MPWKLLAGQTLDNFVLTSARTTEVDPPLVPRLMVVVL